MAQVFLIYGKDEQNCFAFPDESYTVAVGRKEQYIQPYSFYLEVTENTGNRIKF